MNRFIFCILLTALLPLSVSAARHAHKGERPPKALLVMLKTRKRQVKYMAEHRPEKLPRVRKDIQGVMNATLNDFNDHFDYCPVFFFADTMIDEIMAGHFRNVLLDRNMRPSAQTVLPDGDTSFFVADFGHMSQTSKNEFPAEGNVSLREVLIAMDHNFEVLEWPRPAYARGFISTASGRYKDYWYRSPDYEIDYTPQAAAYSLTLQRYYRPK